MEGVRRKNYIPIDTYLLRPNQATLEKASQIAGIDVSKASKD
jgi:hypothetical protein